MVAGVRAPHLPPQFPDAAAGEAAPPSSHLEGRPLGGAARIRAVDNLTHLTRKINNVPVPGVKRGQESEDLPPSWVPCVLLTADH